MRSDQCSALYAALTSPIRLRREGAWRKLEQIREQGLRLRLSNVQCAIMCMLQQVTRLVKATAIYDSSLCSTRTELRCGM